MSKKIILKSINAKLRNGFFLKTNKNPVDPVNPVE